MGGCTGGWAGSARSSADTGADAQLPRPAAHQRAVLHASIQRSSAHRSASWCSGWRPPACRTAGPAPEGRAGGRWGLLCEPASAAAAGPRPAQEWSAASSRASTTPPRPPPCRATTGLVRHSVGLADGVADEGTVAAVGVCGGQARGRGRVGCQAAARRPTSGKGRSSGGQHALKEPGCSSFLHRAACSPVSRGGSLTSASAGPADSSTDAARPTSPAAAACRRSCCSGRAAAGAARRGRDGNVSLRRRNLRRRGPGRWPERESGPRTTLPLVGAALTVDVQLTTAPAGAAAGHKGPGGRGGAGQGGHVV